MRGGGSMILIKDELSSHQISVNDDIDDAFNICAAEINIKSIKLLIVALYRAPWATLDNTKKMCDVLDTIIVSYDHVILAGDFNLPKLKWFNSVIVSDGSQEGILLGNLISEHNLLQLATQPTRDNALLDLIFVSPSLYKNNAVETLHPISTSDHDSQHLNFELPRVFVDFKKTKIDFEKLNLIISQYNWKDLFTGCVGANSYALKFTETLKLAISHSSYVKPFRKRDRLPRYIVSLLRKKKKQWQLANRTGDFSAFRATKRTVRSAIRQHYRNLEQKFIYSNNRKSFFKHINRKISDQRNSINLSADGRLLTNTEAANVFLQEFTNNFASKRNSISERLHGSSSGLQLTCTEQLVFNALRCCPNTMSSTDNISFALLKNIQRHIIRPLNIIFQQSIFSGEFPAIWKRAIVMPLYKGRGDRYCPKSYRPISKSSCLGKLLEKVVHAQLITFLNENNIGNNAQHGFRLGRSTLSNLLSCDAQIAKLIDVNHAYDIITIDFAKAFDKAQHNLVINALHQVGITGTSLRWFASFLEQRKQQVAVGESLSTVGDVISGVVQGSCLGPPLYTILSDSLLLVTRLFKVAFADDVKFIADVTELSRDEVQCELSAITNWSDEHEMPLSIDKCGVMHCGHNQPNHVYYIHGSIIQSIDQFKDLGVIRSQDASYSGHCESVVNKANKMAGLLRRVFKSRSKEMMWPAFIYYVLPTLTYCSPAWHPKQKGNINLLENVQRRYTKRIRGLSNMSYSERLSELNALSVANRLIYSDMTFTYKILHNLTSYSCSDVGLQLSKSNTRGNSLHFVHRKIVSNVHASLFSCRIPPIWNKLPLQIVTSRSLSSFKKHLYFYLMSKQ